MLNREWAYTCKATSFCSVELREGDSDVKKKKRVRNWRRAACLNNQVANVTAERRSTVIEIAN